MTCAAESRYQCPGLSSSYAFSIDEGVADELRPGKPPDGLSPSGAAGPDGRCRLAKQGWRMVMVVPEMPATSHRGWVHAPFPSPKTNSMPDGSRQVDITERQTAT